MASIDRYTPVKQGGVIEKNMPISTAVRDLVFPKVETFDTAEVELDYRKGAYLIAPYVAPYVNGIIMERQGYTTKKYEPPTIAPKRILNPKILQKTIPGEVVHSNMSPEDRQEYYIKRDMLELDGSISRREEQMVCELLTTGKIIVKGYFDESLSKYEENVIDYGFLNKEVLSDGAAWDQGTSQKYKDLQRGVDAVRQAGYNPENIILGQDAWELLRDDADFIKKLDTRRLDLGSILPEVKLQNGTGFVYVGTLTELGVNLWVYYAYYKDYDGTVKKFIPEDHVVILPSEVGDIAYGAITYIEDDENYHTYEGARIPRTLINKQNNVKEMMLSSKPIPRPFDVDSWYVLDVLG